MKLMCLQCRLILNHWRDVGKNTRENHHFLSNFAEPITNEKFAFLDAPILTFLGSEISIYGFLGQLV